MEPVPLRRKEIDKSMQLNRVMSVKLRFDFADMVRFNPLHPSIRQTPDPRQKHAVAESIGIVVPAKNMHVNSGNGPNGRK